MFDKLFKLIVTILLVVSLGCNVFLLKEYASDNVSVNSSTNNVNNVSYDVKSDLTEVIAQAKECTVGVAVYQGNQPAGSGSGVVYRKEGNTVYVITNHHVIDGAQSIEVIFSSGESADAKLLGSDQYGDIAVLELTVDFDVNVYKIGDSELLDTGEVVLAVGSPLGIEYAGTVTQGIVSAPSRNVPVDLNNDGVDDWDMTVIQTDAAINPGNSGGALINSVGELVGITSMKFASEQVEGMGFALPINETVNLAEEIIEDGKVNRPTLGISAISLDRYSSYELHMYRIDTNLRRGIYVADVQKNSAADKAGIKPGDVIVKADGKDIEEYKDFLSMLYSHKSGDQVEMTINRDGTTHSVQVILGGAQ